MMEKKLAKANVIPHQGKCGQFADDTSLYMISH